VADDWKVIQEIAFGDLEKAKLSAKPTNVETLRECGTLQHWNSMYDMTSPQNTVRLARFPKREHFTTTTSDDPVLQELVAAADAAAAADEGPARVYATDTILAVMMAAPRSVTSWDLVVTRKGKTLIFDKRADSRIDYVTVNENWNEVLNQEKDSINTPAKLSTEATLITHSFSQQALTSRKPKKELKEANPFADAVSDGNEAAATAFRYRRFDFGDDIALTTRTSVDGYNTVRGEKLLCSIKALNEFDSKLSGNVDWRQKIEAQIGAVIATEMKNNSNKLTQWTAQAVLSGVDELKLGFVSRIHSKDREKHEVLKTQTHKIRPFAQSLNIKISELWGTLKFLVDAFLEQPDGLYLLLKDPNQPNMKIYSLPPGAFDEHPEEDDDDDDDDDYE
jgi:translation initiation factor 3 subunit D